MSPPKMSKPAAPPVVISGGTGNQLPSSMQQGIPSQVSQGNYRGGLGEYLMKDPATREHTMNFNTTTINTGNRSSFRTTCVLQFPSTGQEFQCSAMGSSKKNSMQNCAKE